VSHENKDDKKSNSAEQPETAYVYRVLRYTPNLVRDEWVNIGVLLFDPQTSERRLRLIEEPEEYRRVRRLHPDADEELLRALRDDLENRFVEFANTNGAGGGAPGKTAWERLLEKWDDTLANALQLTPQRGLLGNDLDAELERLYAERVAPERPASPMGAPGSRASMRHYCSQVLCQAGIWDQLDKSVRASEYTFRGDLMRFDYRYRRNGAQAFLQTLSVTRAPSDAKVLAYTAERIAAKCKSPTAFTALTDVKLEGKINSRDGFVSETFERAGIATVPLESFAAWVGKEATAVRARPR
jgi:hypothetical protein